MPQTIANTLQELSTTPYSYEVYRKTYLWKHYLYAALGIRHVKNINNMLKELLLVSHKYPLPTALEIILQPSHSTWVVLHDYPEVAKKSIDFLLHGIGEEIIDPRDLEAAEAAALAELRIELNNEYYRKD